MSLLGFDALGRLALGQLPPATSIGINEDAWHQPFNTDVVRQRPPYAAARQQFASYVEAAPFPGIFIPADVPLWPQLSEPVRSRKPMHTGAQQFESFVHVFPFYETVTADRWFVPFSEPVRFKKALLPGSQEYYMAPEFFISSGTVLELVTVLANATLSASPTGHYKQVLSQTSRRVIFAAEISPYTLS